MKSSNPALPSTDQNAVSELIQKLVDASPSLGSLTADDLATVAKAVVFDELKDELKHRLDVARIDLAAKRELFLSRYRSQQTRQAYRAALQALDSWAERAGVMLLDLKPRHADAYIASCTGSPSSIRLRIAAASSFFTFLDRETEGRVRNPFLGTRLRPTRASATPKVPSETDVATILGAVKGDLKAACIAVIEHGFRVGALPTLQIWGGRFQGESKGKSIAGVLSERTKAALAEANLDPRNPWQTTSADSLRNRFQYLCRQLSAQHLIAEAYSIHDLRHYFAINHYQQHKDIYALKHLLGHASIQVTEHYLKGMQAYI
ncbi:MAG TPA: tyrosine-type recombinase/integrase [Spirochaetales bacterium]|nr:tyrosine-type recombinase/integrase [Spirochaetales bacterium]